MGTSITSGRWKVDTVARVLYRDKAVENDGTPAGTTTDSVLTLYSDLQDLFDQPEYMDDTVPMTAQTPTEFTVGGTDPEFPWFMSPPDAKFLTGGAIQTAGWTRTQDSENGIVMVSYTGATDPVDGDIGNVVTDLTNSDTGRLVGYDATDLKLWIRPTDDTSTHNWDTGSGNLDVTGGTSGIGAMDAASVTGEYLWANPNSVGVFSDHTATRGYVYQDGAKITNWPDGIGLNADGEFDILLLVKENDTEIDQAVATFFARRGGALGDWFESDFTNGGRVTIPLTGNPDNVNDSVGHHNVTWTIGGGAALAVGDVVVMDSDDEIAAVVINVNDSGATGDFDFVLVRSLTQLTNAAASAESPATKTMTLGTPTNLTPVTDGQAGTPQITFTHGAFTRDINNGAGARPYSIDVDPDTASWERVYQHGKYITRRGSTTQIDGINGESYRGSTLQIKYTSQTGSFVEGETVYDTTTGAQGVIVADHGVGTGDGNGLILRAVRGSFTATNTVGDAPSGPTDFATIDSTRVIPTLKFAPLGNLAGTLWQGAPGMAPVLANIASGREQDYSLIDDEGAVQNPPNTVAVEVSSLGIDDWVSVFRLTAPFSSGGTIVKNEYGSHASNNVLGDVTFDVDATISQEAPPAGWIRVEDDSTGDEHRYRYSSYSGVTFTFLTDSDWTSAASTATNTDATGLTLQDSTASFQSSGVEPGMMVRNVTDGDSYGIVQSVDSETQLTLEPLNHATATTPGNGLTGGTNDDWTSGDDYRINELVTGYVAADDVYVPFLDQKNVAGTDETTTIIQSTDIDVLVRVRNGGVILPFQAGQTIGANGMEQAAIRTLDSIAT